MPGMAALFTQARSSKLLIPHPHGICIMGLQGPSVPGRAVFLNPDRKKKYSSITDMILTWTGWHFKGLCFVSIHGGAVGALTHKTGFSIQIKPGTICLVGSKNLPNLRKLLTVISFVMTNMKKKTQLFSPDCNDHT